MKIIVIDAHSNDYEELAKISCPVKADYCSQHDYEFKICNIETDFSRTPHWHKIKAIEQNIKKCDWLFYCDTDVVITNKSVKLEDIIDDKYDLICGPMPFEGQISTSSFLIRNCEWSYRFLDTWYKQAQFIDKPYYPHPDSDFYATGSYVKREGGTYFEQSAFAYLYDTDESVRSRIKRIKSNLFLSYKPDNFLIHFPGGTPELKLKHMQILMSKL
jgi:hypothetical protein